MSYLTDKKGLNLFSSKVTFPIIGIIWQYPEFKSILTIVKQRSSNPEYSTYVRTPKVENRSRSERKKNIQREKEETKV